MCHECKQLKAFLSQNNIEFEDFDLTGNDGLIEYVVQKSKHHSVPISNIDDKWISGFNIQEWTKFILKTILELDKKPLNQHW